MAYVATGNWEVAGDSDWFAVELVAGQSYTLGIDGPAGAVFRAQGPDGEEFFFDATASNVSNATGHFTALTGGTYWFSTTGVAAGGYKVVLSEVADDFDDNQGSSGRIASGQSVAGRAEASNDGDWFATTMQTGREYTFKVASTGDFDVFVADRNGIILTPLNVDAGGTGTFVPTVAGDYFIVVQESGDAALGRPVPYTLSLSDAAVTDDYGQTPATAGRIVLDAAGVGDIDARLNYSTDSDWFAVEVKAGETYRVRIGGAATGTDGFIAVVGPDGEFTNFPSGFGRQSANETSFTATADGVYYVTANSSKGATNYNLEVAKIADDYTDSAVRPGTVTVNGGTVAAKFEAAFDTDWFAVQVVAGQSYSLSAVVPGSRSPYFALGNFVDANGKLLGPTFTATTSGTVYVEVTGFTSTVNAPVTSYNVGAQSYVDDYADNAGTKGTIAVGGTAKGNIQAQQDSDWFRIELVEGKSYTFGASGGFLPPTLTLFDAQGNALTTAGVWTAKTSGTYYLAATGFLPGAYTLQAREYADDYVDYDASTGQFAGAPGYSGNGEVKTGTANADTLSGGSRDDLLQGFGGNDTLKGSRGNDVLDGGTGIDRMSGGAGDDSYVVDAAQDKAIEKAGEGYDTVNASVSFKLGDNVEALTLVGTANLSGTGNALDNRLTGNAGDNKLSGGDGADVLTGGAGIDKLTGGTGADRFVFASDDTGNARSSADTILDFSRADGDRIDLSAIDASTRAGGDQGFAWIGTGAFTRTAGELRAEVIGGDTYVSGDVDGNGRADFMIRVEGTPALAASDFIL